MKQPTDDKSLWFVIDKLHSDLSRVEDQVGIVSQDSSAMRSTLDHVASKVDHLTKVVTTGNGQPALVVQLAEIRKDLDSNFHALKSDLEIIKQINTTHVVSQVDLKRHRLLTMGKILVVAIGIIPGVLAYFFK